MLIIEKIIDRIKKTEPPAESKVFFYDTSSYSWMRTEETLQLARKKFEYYANQQIPVKLIAIKHKWTDETEGFWVRLDDQPLCECDILIDQFPKTT